MDQIVKNILKQQGFDHIGVFDKENNIWIYTKDGKVNFCRSDLSSIDRKTIGLEAELIVLTEDEDAVRVIKGDETFSNFLVIDKDNKILVQARQSEKKYYPKESKDAFLLEIINEDVFFISSKENIMSHNFDEREKPSICSLCSWNSYSAKRAYLFSDNEYLEHYDLCSSYNDFFFFEKTNENKVTILRKGKGFVSDEIKYGYCRPYLWIHEDDNAQIIYVENDSEKMDVSDIRNGENEDDIQNGIVNIIALNAWYSHFDFKASEYVPPIEIRDNNTELDSDYFSEEYKFLYTNEYVVFPFAGKYGAFVITYEDDWVNAHSIIFDSYSEYYRIELNDKILYLDHSHTYYDIYGNKLGSYDNRDKDYLIYTDKRSVIGPNYDAKGVINRYSNKIVVPPIFKEIEIINDDYGLFEVTYLHSGHFKMYETKGIYSANEGFIIPYGTEFNYPDYYNNVFKDKTYLTKRVTKFIIYAVGEKKGLIYKGKKVEDLLFDDITGYDLFEDFSDEPDTQFYVWDDDSDIRKKTEEFAPLSVILWEQGKVGIFYERENDGSKDFEIIQPQYDYIAPIKLFNENMYFKVYKDKKCGIISDNSSFNKQNTIDYDHVEFKTIIDDNCYFIVMKDGKVGAISTKGYHNVPVIFDKIDSIVRSGVICNSILYNREGKEIMSLGDNCYIKTKHCDVFMVAGSEEYLFVDSQGKILECQKDEDDDNIINVDGIGSFDIDEENFIEEDNDYYMDYGSDYTQEELDDMYRAAFEGDPDAQWNID